MIWVHLAKLPAALTGNRVQFRKRCTPSAARAPLVVDAHTDGLEGQIGQGDPPKDTRR